MRNKINIGLPVGGKKVPVTAIPFRHYRNKIIDIVSKILGTK